MRDRLIKVKIIPTENLNYNVFKIDLMTASNLFANSDIQASEKSLAHELRNTWLLSIFLKKFDKRIDAIGFPCKKEKIDGLYNPEIKFLEMISVKAIEFDTIIHYSDVQRPFYRKIQVVRYVHQKQKGTSELFQFLKEKKFNKYQKDNSLYLLICMEEAFKFEYANLAELLKTIPINFENIIAIGHTGEADSLKYFAVKLHPKVEGPHMIDFRKPPELYFDH